jgi:hypothetical protein
MQIEIMLKTGPVKVEADIIGPFGVHRAAPALDVWRVTHLATGCAIPVVFVDRRQAIGFAEKIGPLKNYWADTDIEFSDQQRAAVRDLATQFGGEVLETTEEDKRRSKLRRAGMKPLNGEDRFQ